MISKNSNKPGAPMALAVSINSAANGVIDIVSYVDEFPDNFGFYEKNSFNTTVESRHTPFSSQRLRFHFQIG